MKLRKSPQTLQVLTEFLHTPSDWKYGYDISRDTGLKSGTLYPILMRLAEHALLETRWESAEPGKPPRHTYKLTADGMQYARQSLPARSRAVRNEPAFSGAKNS